MGREIEEWNKRVEKAKSEKKAARRDPGRRRAMDDRRALHEALARVEEPGSRTGKGGRL